MKLGRQPVLLAEVGLLVTQSGEGAAWQFRSRFRCGAFGSRGSKLAISRIDGALAEFRATARRDPVRGAEGAVLFVEKLSPACRTKSLSGWNGYWLTRDRERIGCGKSTAYTVAESHGCHRPRSPSPGVNGFRDPHLDGGDGVSGRC